MKTKVVRIYWKDYRRFRKIVKGERNETLANYFQRVIKLLEEQKNGKN